MRYRCAIRPRSSTNDPLPSKCATSISNGYKLYRGPSQIATVRAVFLQSATVLKVSSIRGKRYGGRECIIIVNGDDTVPTATHCRAHRIGECSFHGRFPGRKLDRGSIRVSVDAPSSNIGSRNRSIQGRCLWLLLCRNSVVNRYPPYDNHSVSAKGAK
jgi:hypothetical protein